MKISAQVSVEIADHDGSVLLHAGTSFPARTFTDAYLKGVQEIEDCRRIIENRHSHLLTGSNVEFTLKIRPKLDITA